jgi:hypothetical protein
LLTVSMKLGLKVAVTDFAALMVTEQVAPETELQPVQPPKVDPLAAAAVSVTVVPLAYGSEQSAPQLIPAGVDVTVPLPAPGLLTDSVKVGGGARLKVAVTVRAAVIVTVHVAPDDELHPVQLANVDPDPADAVRVTVVPLS